MTLNADKSPDVRRATGRAPSDRDRSGVPSAAHPSAAPPFPRRPLRQLLGEPGMSVVGVAGSGAAPVQTLLLTPSGNAAPRLAVRVPTTADAETVVEREARMLVEVRRLPLGQLRATLPRFVQLCEADERLVLVESALPGRRLPGAFCRSWQVRHRRCVAAELDAATAWLGQFQEATWQRPAPLDLLPADVLERLDRPEQPSRLGRTDPRHRRGGPPDDRGAGRCVAERAARVQDRLGRHEAPRSAVHGDFRVAQLLVDTIDGALKVSGVLGWRLASTTGEPLVDLGRLVTTYPGCRDRTGTLPGAAVLVGRGATAAHARQVLRRELVRLGIPESLWYAVAWAAAARLLAGADGPADRGVVAGLARLLADAPDPATA